MTGKTALAAAALHARVQAQALQETLDQIAEAAGVPPGNDQTLLTRVRELACGAGRMKQAGKEVGEASAQADVVAHSAGLPTACVVALVEAAQNAHRGFQDLDPSAAGWADVVSRRYAQVGAATAPNKPGRAPKSKG